MTEVIFSSHFASSHHPCNHHHSLQKSSNSDFVDTKKKTLMTTEATDFIFLNQALPIDFEPGEFDVICSQGKKAKVHTGNIYFRAVVQKRAKEYSKTFGKKDKSKIVRDIIQHIQTKSPSGGFVQKIAVTETIKGRCSWKLIDAERAREKVSQCLRNILVGQYRSSQDAKKRSRKASNLKKIIDFQEIVASNHFVSERIRQLAMMIRKNCLSEPQFLRLMSKTNLEILLELKNDQTVQRKVQSRPPSTVRNHEEELEFANESSPSPTCGVDEILKKFQSDDMYILLQQPDTKRRKTK